MAIKKYFNTRKVAYNLQIESYKWLRVEYGINEIDEEIAARFPALFELIEKEVKIDKIKTIIGNNMDNDNQEDESINQDLSDDTGDLFEDFEGNPINNSDEAPKEIENEYEEKRELDESDEESKEIESGMQDDGSRVNDLISEINNMKKKELIEYAEEKEIEIDKRKGVKKLKEAILESLALME